MKILRICYNIYSIIKAIICNQEEFSLESDEPFWMYCIFMNKCTLGRHYYLCFHWFKRGRGSWANWPPPQNRMTILPPPKDKARKTTCMEGLGRKNDPPLPPPPLTRANLELSASLGCMCHGSKVIVGHRPRLLVFDGSSKTFLRL